MIKKLLILIFIVVLAYFSWWIVFFTANYITSAALGYKTEITRYFIDSEIRHIARERLHQQYIGNPPAPDPDFERHKLMFQISGAVAVILVGLAGCAVIWFSKRDSKLLKHPFKWIWIYFAVYLLRTPYAVAVFFYKEWIGDRSCVYGDAMYIGYFGLNFYIFSPIICVVLLVCMGTALYKALALPAVIAEPFEQYK